MAIRLPDRWIWDSWYIWDGDVCHAFYLCASKGLGDPNRRHRYTSVGHAISTDLVNWEILPDALSPSDSPAFDSWTTWTGSCVRGDDGKWWMFYTGTSREDGGQVQRIGAAVSDDLLNWAKVNQGPILSASGEFYEKLGDSKWHDEAWRDPWVCKLDDDDRWHMFITARANDGDVAERGVLGHAVSNDLINWEIMQPLSSAGQGFGQLEVFQYAEVDGVPILIFCCGWRELGAQRLEGFGKRDATYSVPVGKNLASVDFRKARAFEEQLVYAGRLVRDNDGRWFLLGFVNEVDGEFIGEICDPIPVTADPEIGLIPRA